MTTSVTSTSYAPSRPSASVERVRRVDGRRDPVARAPQHPLEQRPQRRLVLAQQHGLRAPGARRPPAPPAPRSGEGASSGAAGRNTRNVEPRPSVDSTAIRPPACVTVPCTDARPSPVPSPISFVVKNGSKMFSSSSGAMPVPVSATRDARVGSLVEMHRLGRDAQRPAVGHRVARVDGEVHDDLLELPAVGDDGHHVRVGADDELQVGAEQPLEHRPHADDGLGDVDGRRRRRPLPGERQELRRQLRRAARRALDLLHGMDVRLALHLPRQDAGVAGDHRHEVVEVVRDAARETAERLEALGLAELLGQPLGLGHVADDQRGRGELAVVVMDGERRDGVMRLRAVRARRHHLDVRDRLAARDPLLAPRAPRRPARRAGPPRAAAPARLRRARRTRPPPRGSTTGRSRRGAPRRSDRAPTRRRRPGCGAAPRRAALP